jgi:hypothetical protein
MKYIYFLGAFSIGVIFVNVTGMWYQAFGFGLMTFGGVATLIEVIKYVTKYVTEKEFY